MLCSRVIYSILLLSFMAAVDKITLRKFHVLALWFNNVNMLELQFSL